MPLASAPVPLMTTLPLAHCMCPLLCPRYHMRHVTMHSAATCATLLCPHHLTLPCNRMCHRRAHHSHLRCAPHCNHDHDHGNSIVTHHHHEHEHGGAPPPRSRALLPCCLYETTREVK